MIGSASLNGWIMPRREGEEKTVGTHRRSISESIPALIEKEKI
jgi:hypothetical protein